MNWDWHFTDSAYYIMLSDSSSQGFIRKFSLLETEIISADLLQSQLEMPTSSTASEFLEGHIHVAHYDTTLDLVSACVKFTASDEKDYFNIWSVVV